MDKIIRPKHAVKRLPKKIQARITACVFTARFMGADLYYNPTIESWAAVWEDCQGDLNLCTAQTEKRLRKITKEAVLSDAEVGPVGEYSEVQPEPE